MVRVSQHVSCHLIAFPSVMSASSPFLLLLLLFLSLLDHPARGEEEDTTLELVLMVCIE